MLVELHILQNFAPANLNRDDTGSPKDCDFGGYRRARISSQCLKRAVRTEFDVRGLLPTEHLASRTKRLLEDVASRLVTGYGYPPEMAEAVVQLALGGIGLTVAQEKKTQYLLFLGQREIERFAEICAENWDALAAPLAVPASATAGTRARDAKKSGKDAVSPAIQSQLKGLLDGGRAADLGLFGRMLADLPEKNIDAASQVAHALSTTKVSMEFDFYTAVDDLKPEDTAGADMLGTVEFNSACFYRYANVDVAQLLTNLGGDADLTERTVEAFVRASVSAVPTGKQNSFAAHNPPSLVLAVMREDAPCSLTNAFLRPVTPTAELDVMQRSVQALDTYWGKLQTMYGEGKRTGMWLCTTEPEQLSHLKDANVDSMNQLVQNLRAAISNGSQGQGV